MKLAYRIIFASFMLFWLVQAVIFEDANTALSDNCGSCTSSVFNNLGNFKEYAAASCKQIACVKPQAKSGNYWVKGGSGPAGEVYCAFGDGPCGTEVWMRIANIDMTQTDSSCPADFESVTSPKPLCRKKVKAGCASDTYSTYGVSFSKVCGKAIGVQFGWPNAFGPTYHNRGSNIDTGYVDGVSITYGQNPRKHIWTFAAAIYDVPPAPFIYNCPCSAPKTTFTGKIPDYVGNDYFCETGSREKPTKEFYTADPLWDGKGCPASSKCCDGNQKPWFQKTFPNAISSDVEMRLCANDPQNKEDVLLEELSLWVQ